MPRDPFDANLREVTPSPWGERILSHPISHPIGQPPQARAERRTTVLRSTRARDVLVARGYDARDAALLCFSAAGFDAALRSRAAQDQAVRLVDPAMLYE